MIDNRLEIIVEIPNSTISTPDNPNGITRYNLDTFPPEQQEPIEINYCINDINDISNRNASSSKTITLPETDNNREVFGFISDLNLQVNTFSPNKRAKCYVMLDTIVVLEGWLQLKNIKPNYRTGLTKLECIVYSNQLDFFKAVGESYLQDLQEFNQMSYTYSYNEITSSWFKGQGDTDVYYPLIDYGFGFDSDYKEIATDFDSIKMGFNNGSGFVNVNQMFPAVYLKSVIDAIFHSANSETYTDPSTGLSSSVIYQYDSNFFNSDWFKYLIIPYNNGIITSPNYNQLTLTTTCKSNFTVLEYPLSRNISWESVDSTEFTASGGNLTYNGIPSSNNFIFNFVSRVTPLGMGSYTVTVKFKLNSVIKKTYTFTFPGTVSSNLIINDIFNFVINTGDIISVNISVSGQSATYFTNVNLILQSLTTSDFLNILGQTFNVNQILPKNIKQKDFLNSLFRLFNLYIDYDVNNPTILRIEPRDDYYYFNGPNDNFYGNPGFNLSNLQIKDWSDKVDINQDVNIQLLAETQNKTIKLTYKEDKDYFNENYISSIGRVYGDKIIEIDNDFNFGEQVIEVLFGPTVLANIPGSTNFPISNLTKQIDSSSNLPNGRTNTAPRILQRARGVNVDGTLFPTIYGLFNTDTWRLGTTSSSALSQYYYPYAGNLDNPYSPSTDLNFDTNFINYFYSTTTTDNNLYNTFYQNQFNEILDVNSKILTAQLYLNPQDIRDFKFSDVIFLRLGSSGQYYHVNKINNYSLTTPYKTVEVELIKIKEIANYPLPTQNLVDNKLVLSTTTPIGTPFMATMSLTSDQYVLSKISINCYIRTFNTTTFAYTNYPQTIIFYPGDQTTTFTFTFPIPAQEIFNNYGITSISPNRDLVLRDGVSYGVYNYTF